MPFTPSGEPVEGTQVPLLSEVEYTLELANTYISEAYAVSGIGESVLATVQRTLQRVQAERAEQQRVAEVHSQALKEIELQDWD